MNLPAARKQLLLETTMALLEAAWLVRRHPFFRYVARLGLASGGEFLDADHVPVPGRLLGDVRWALRRMNQFSGGRFTCLMLAMAGKQVLNRRGLANTIVLGVRPDTGAGDDPIGAHAWLRVGDFVVIGEEEREGHIAVVSYHSASHQVIA